MVVGSLANVSSCHANSLTREVIDDREVWMRNHSAVRILNVFGQRQTHDRSRVARTFRSSAENDDWCGIIGDVTDWNVVVGVTYAGSYINSLGCDVEIPKWNGRNVRALNIVFRKRYRYIKNKVELVVISVNARRSRIDAIVRYLRKVIAVCIRRARVPKLIERWTRAWNDDFDLRCAVVDHTPDVVEHGFVWRDCEGMIRIGIHLVRRGRQIFCT